ncbi:alpha/beta fold hydrolase [Alkalibacter mobilis]|uniref:alpha/beta fold hydrolase n=1 Tax=Alkalibacter mobilis TaxID=2787712 RepID=UPI00189E202B|nr:alpha/beta hydrolase [Alkalibacter mobilis]MBF7096546.1 alpha/beta hydrolase [Alkalibacter mobilis]
MYTKELFKSFDETNIYWYKWPAHKQQVGSAIIIHGMAEHSLRYNNFASFLNSAGYDVYALDLRGHGATGEDSLLGWFGPQKGWFNVLDDIKLFIEKAIGSDENMIMIGHSMGSLLVRSYLIKYFDSRISKVVLSGTTAGLSDFQMKASLNLAKLACSIGDPKEKSYFMDKMIFGSYANSVKDPSTTFDWLTRDNSVVNEYIEDPLCGFVCTKKFYVDLITGTLYCNNVELIHQTCKNAKILFVGGSQDPVGRFGRDIFKLKKLYTQVLGTEKVEIELFENFRHEVLNEIGKESVYERILKFIS